MSALARPGRAAVLAGILVCAYALTHASAPAELPTTPSFEAVPFEIGAWAGQDAPPLDPDVAAVLAADQYVHRYYQGSGGVIEMDVSYYTQPRVGSSLHSPLNCLPGNGWGIESIATRTVQTAAGPADVREMIVERGVSRYALTYWFHGRQRILADEFSARFYVLGDALRRRPTDAGLVRVMMPVAQGGGAVEQATLTAFAGQLIPEINKQFR